MDKNPTTVVTQLHHQQWLADIRECNARPKGMTVGEWCQLHGIKTNTYYWRQKTLRKEYLKEILPEERRPEQFSPAPSFVEIPQTFLSAKPDSVTLTLGESHMDIPESISDEFLRRILEAARYA